MTKTDVFVLLTAARRGYIPFFEKMALTHPGTMKKYLFILFGWIGDSEVGALGL
jgi:hypothetical protein